MIRQINSIGSAVPFFKQAQTPVEVPDPGIQEKVLVLDGANEAVISQRKFPFGINDSFTIYALCKRNAINGNYGIHGNYYSAEGKCFVFYFRGNNCIDIFIRQESGSSLTIRTDLSYTDILNYHIFGVTYDGSGLVGGFKVFIDNLFVNTYVLDGVLNSDFLDLSTNWYTGAIGPLSVLNNPINLKRFGFANEAYSLAMMSQLVNQKMISINPESAIHEIDVSNGVFGDSNYTFADQVAEGSNAISLNCEASDLVAL